MAEWVKATRIERFQTLAGAQPDLRDLTSLLQGSSSLVTFGLKLMHAVINIGLVRLSPREWPKVGKLSYDTCSCGAILKYKLKNKLKVAFCM